MPTRASGGGRAPRHPPKPSIRVPVPYAPTKKGAAAAKGAGYPTGTVAQQAASPSGYTGPTSSHAHVAAVVGAAHPAAVPDIIAHVLTSGLADLITPHDNIGPMPHLNVHQQAIKQPKISTPKVKVAGGNPTSNLVSAAGAVNLRAQGAGHRATTLGGRGVTQGILNQRPRKFAGKPVLGRVKLGALAQARQQGTLKTIKGKQTTPGVRKLISNLYTKSGKVRQQRKQRLLSQIPNSNAERYVALLDAKIGPKYGIPASTLMSQQRQESGFNPNAVSSAGAFGVSQFIPGTAQTYGVKPGSSKAAVKSQVRGQAAYLRDLGFRQDPQKALSGYSGGYAASAYNNPVLAGARDFKAADRLSKVLSGPIINKPVAQKLVKLGVISPQQAPTLAGAGPAPKQVVTHFQAISKAADFLTSQHIPYGPGMHGSTWEAHPSLLDCSSAVSWVLHAAGYKLPGNVPHVSGDFTPQGMPGVLAPGPGAVTVFANGGHVFLRVGNKYWGTSAGDSGAGGLGPHPAPGAAYLAGFTVSHPIGLGKKQALQLGFRPGVGGAAAGGSFPGMTLSNGGTTATINSGAGTKQTKAGFTSAPLLLDLTGIAASAPLPTDFLNFQGGTGTTTSGRPKTRVGGRDVIGSLLRS